MDEKYIKAFERIKTALAKVGCRVVEIAGLKYVCGNISDSSPFLFRQNDVIVEIAKDDYIRGTYVTTSRKRYVARTDTDELEIQNAYGR